MSSSLILQRFSEYLENPKVLTHPQEFLGPNTEKVLEFWLKIEKLTQEQLKIVKERYHTFWDENFSEWDRITDLAWKASEEVVRGKYGYHASWAAYGITNSAAMSWATDELIGGVENPTFLKMFDNL